MKVRHATDYTESVTVEARTSAVTLEAERSQTKVRITTTEDSEGTLVIHIWHGTMILNWNHAQAFRVNEQGLEIRGHDE